MTMQEKGILFTVAKARVVVSRVFGFIILLLILFTGRSFDKGTITGMLFEMSGLFLLTICCFGRLWALMYISGIKKRQLVTDGPYSMLRHPLYLFSLIGVCGIGLASENLLVLALLIIFYLLYYPLTILVEEKKLIKKFGASYREYMKSTPRFLPKLSLYREPELYNVRTAKFVRNFADGMWFIWMFIFLHFIEMLQDSGLLPVILKIP